MQGRRAAKHDARAHLPAVRLAVHAEKLARDQVRHIGNRDALRDVHLHALPNDACGGDELDHIAAPLLERDQVHTARPRLLDVAPLDTAGKREARILVGVEQALVNVSERPVVEPRAQKLRGRHGCLVRIEIEPGMDHADAERCQGGVFPKGLVRGSARGTLGDADIRGPCLVVVAAPAEHAHGLAVPMVKRKARLVGGEHGHVARQVEQVALPGGIGVVVSGAHVHRNALGVEARKAVEKCEVVGIGRSRRIENVAGNHHEVDAIVDGGGNHAFVRFGNRLDETARPTLGKGPKAAKRRSDMKIGCMDECQALRHRKPPLMRIRRRASRR